MSRQTTKDDLLYYLTDPKVRVIALNGLWGTGKTHLWDEIKSDFPAIDGNDHLYASCFGLESLEQIKNALFQNSLGRAEGTVTAARKFSGFTIDVLEKIASKVAPGAEGAATVVGSLGGLIQSALIDKVLHSRLIVLDDIERRTKTLQVETLLGFIDLLKRNDCKILLILNEEPLESHASDWRTLKEKCIDREITLLTTSVDAASIGLSQDMPYLAVVTDTLARLKVSNIRVIQRIDRIVKTIFGDAVGLPDGLQKSLLPATVTLTALNFNAVPSGPDVASLMKRWPAWCGQPRFFDDDRQEMSDAVAFGVHVKLTRDVEYLALLMQHILTGHRLKEQFDFLFQQRREQEASNQAENAAIRYIEDTLLDPGMTNQDFIARATDHKAAWVGISADKVSAIASDLEWRGAGVLAQEIAGEWARRWKESPKLWNSNLHSLDNFYPVIKDAILEGNRHFSSIPSLLDAVLKVSTGGWVPGDAMAINDATVDEIIETIYALDREHFGSFIYFYRKEIRDPIQQAGTEPPFKAGTDTFLRAARRIVAEAKRPRFTELLKQHLGEQAFSASDILEQETDTGLKETS
ncbi:hypothetical protein [Hydrogenophaga flava]|uniref:hypothetical protein n=1 Tax=Hydrogenophaga flava TaxID=65657 RepID=UPI0008251C79|nr:hypothetical protein [Hydrogenophaga flava]